MPHKHRWGLPRTVRRVKRQAANWTLQTTLLIKDFHRNTRSQNPAATKTLVGRYLRDSRNAYECQGSTRRRLTPPPPGSHTQATNTAAHLTGPSARQARPQQVLARGGQGTLTRCPGGLRRGTAAGDDGPVCRRAAGIYPGAAKAHRTQRLARKRSYSFAPNGPAGNHPGVHQRRPKQNAAQQQIGRSCC